MWGLGHAATLLLLAGGCILFGFAIPERTGALLEAAVGLMLVGLGLSVFLRMRRGHLHLHGHVHADGTAHLHVHSHAPGALHATDGHAHGHPRGSLRALLVGAVHGLAGSAALVLLVGSAARTPLVGLAYVALFGLGAVVGMMLLAATIALPLGYSARRRIGLHRLLCAGAGAFSVALGLQLVWSFAASAG
jgi:hypothetical protein